MDGIEPLVNDDLTVPANFAKMAFVASTPCIRSAGIVPQVNIDDDCTMAVPIRM